MSPAPFVHDADDLTGSLGFLSLASAREVSFSVGTWTLVRLESATDHPHPAPPSTNQANHLSTSLARAKSGTAQPRWHAVAFTVDQELTDEALGHALVSLAVRHETLRHNFVASEVGLYSRRSRKPGLLRSVIEQIDEQDGSSIPQAIDGMMDPFGWPAFGLFARRVEGGTEVVLAFEPINVDLYSLLMVARDFVDIVRGRERPAAGSFVDYSRLEESEDLAGAEMWRPFFEGAGGHVPLGLAPGASAPLTYRRARLADARTAGRFDDWCASLGAEGTSGVLGLLAFAWESFDARQFKTVAAVQTRMRPEWDETVGWFVEGIPIVIPLDHYTPSDYVRRARQAFYAALAGPRIPMQSAMDELGVERDRSRRERFCWTSFLDVRKAADESGLDGVVSISRTEASGDDLDFWFVRDHGGLVVYVRLPDTPEAHASTSGVMGVLLDQVTRQGLQG